MVGQLNAEPLHEIGVTIKGLRPSSTYETHSCIRDGNCCVCNWGQHPKVISSLSHKTTELTVHSCIRVTAEITVGC